MDSHPLERGCASQAPHFDSRPAGVDGSGVPRSSASAHPARDKILALVAEIGEKQRFLNSQLIGWAEAESEAVSKYDREIERLMQVHLTPEQEQRELDAIQGVYRRTDEQVSAHYDPLVARAKKELADLGSDLFDICESPTET
jgi:hypothetical protein